MISNSTDSHWERWGQRDPYFGVITNNKYRSANLSGDAMREFFESGRHHVAHVLDTTRRFVDPGFLPRVALDFGCGPGRIAIALAQVAQQVVGVDVSASMLDEAKRNCKTHGVSNVRLLRSDDALSCLDGGFDFIHSNIVFQHIPAARGRRIFAGLLEQLTAGGIGALHFSYSKARFGNAHGRIPISRTLLEPLVRIKRILRSHLPGRDPEMEMNPYDMNQLMYLIQSAGIEKFHAELRNDSGQLSVVLYFQKPIQT